MAQTKARPYRVEDYEWPDWLPDELTSLGGKEAAKEAARKAIEESLARQQAGQLTSVTGKDSQQCEQMGFG